MVKSSAVLFILGFALILKLEKPVSCSHLFCNLNLFISVIQGGA